MIKATEADIGREVIYVDTYAERGRITSIGQSNVFVSFSEVAEVTPQGCPPRSLFWPDELAFVLRKYRDAHRGSSWVGLGFVFGFLPLGVACTMAVLLFNGEGINPEANWTIAGCMSLIIPAILCFRKGFKKESARRKAFFEKWPTPPSMKGEAQ